MQLSKKDDLDVYFDTVQCLLFFSQLKSAAFEVLVRRFYKHGAATECCLFDLQMTCIGMFWPTDKKVTTIEAGRLCWVSQMALSLESQGSTTVIPQVSGCCPLLTFTQENE